MKKFICLLAAILVAFAAVSCTSCSGGDVQWGIKYSLQSDGQANGNVAMTFDGGSFDLNGEADYAFAWSNEVLLSVEQSIPLEVGLASKDLSTAKAANYVNEWVENSIKVTSAKGTYDIYVKGYVKETATGLTFAIDKHFTNIPAADDPTVDPE